MDTSRQIYALADLVTSAIGCGLWCFAYTRFRGVRVFAVLALTHTARLIASVDNVHLAFTDRLFSPFSSVLRFFTVVSYASIVIWIVEAVAYIMLVRWILQSLRKGLNHESTA